MRATAARSAPLARPSTPASRGFGVVPRRLSSSIEASRARRPFASRRASLLGSRPRTLAIVAAIDGDPYVVGCGTGDCTGPIDGVGMMGYASVSQTTNSLWQRQWARAFVLSSAPPGPGARLRPDTTVAIVVVDACMIFPDLKAAALREVSAILAARAVADASRESSPYDAENLAGSFDALVRDDLLPVDVSPFDETNVCVCATHTHAAPGGYAPHPLYNLTLGGGVRDSFRAQLDGVVDAILAAHDDAATRVRPANVSIAKRRLKGVAVNRSAAAYARNPREERDAHEGDVDDTMTVLAAFDSERDGVESGPDAESEPGVVGAMAWFAVHGTSLRRTNRSVSGDNKGVASWLAETALRGDVAGARALVSSFGSDVAEAAFSTSSASSAPARAAAAVASGGFTRAGRAGRGHGAVVAFPQGASGDVSPNVRGAWRVESESKSESGGAGDGERVGARRPCDGRSGATTTCVGEGPAGADDVAGCVATGAAQAAAALGALRDGDATPVRGPVASAHAWLPLGRGFETRSGTTAAPALGYSFAAGTTDGPGADGFVQGDTDDETEAVAVAEAETMSKSKSESESESEANASSSSSSSSSTTTSKPRRRFRGAFASWVFSGFRRWGVPSSAAAAHAPKPVLAHFGEDGGEGSDGDRAPWVAMDVPVQVFRVGRALIVSIPAEVSTHAGRRLARVARLAASEAEASTSDDSEWEVIVNGLANGYAGYVTTPEEYAAQMYEGASTLYGPNTLAAYEDAVDALVRRVASPVVATETDPSEERISADAVPGESPSLAPSLPAPADGAQAVVFPVDLRWPPWRGYGACEREVADADPEDGLGRAKIVAGASGEDGEAVATFVAGRPRRLLSPPPLGTYMVVDRLLRGAGLDGLEHSRPRWVTVATDDDLSTSVEWRRAAPLGLGSRITARWKPPAGTPPGTYRVGVVGAARGFRRWVTGKDIAVYRGYSSPFEVVEESERDEGEEEEKEETRVESTAGAGIEVAVELEDERRAGETVVYRFG